MTACNISLRFGHTILKHMFRRLNEVYYNDQELQALYRSENSHTRIFNTHIASFSMYGIVYLHLTSNKHKQKQ